MIKYIQTALLIILGSVACLLMANVFVHLIIYLIDGTIVKFFSQIWLGIILITALVSGTFMYLLMNRSGWTN